MNLTFRLGMGQTLGMASGLKLCSQPRHLNMRVFFLFFLPFMQYSYMPPFIRHNFLSFSISFFAMENRIEIDLDSFYWILFLLCHINLFILWYFIFSLWAYWYLTVIVACGNAHFFGFCLCVVILDGILFFFLSFSGLSGMALGNFGNNINGRFVFLLLASW